MKRNLLTIFAMFVILPCGLTSCKRDSNLHQAAESGNIEAVTDYIEDKADINAKDNKWGSAPLTLAAHKKTDTPETAAKQTKIIKRLLAKGAKVNTADILGCTALIYAVEYNNTATIAALLENTGLNLSAKGENGKTALMIATEKGHKMAAEALKAAGITE